MKIVSSSLGMDAAAVYREVNNGEGLVTGSRGGAVPEVQFQFDRTDLQSGVLQMAAGRECSGLRAVSTVIAPGRVVEHDCTEETAVARIIAEVAGGQVRMREFSPLFTKAGAGDDAGDIQAGGRRAFFSGGSSLQLSLGLRQVQYSREMLNVNSSGTILTDDGRQISFNLELMMEREETVLRQSYTKGISSRFIDPLVLSFSGGLAMLGDSTFSFDLNGDGEDEEISCLSSGSGFLVLDKDGNGVVDDGRELFGPRTGFGYDELSIYDVDGNTWIDENDPVFDQLQLWMGGGGENGRLISLREAGVGALSLASADALFHMKDSNGRITGQIRQSGLFVTENGEVRPMAELDLLVPEEREPVLLAGFSPGMRLALENLRDMIAMHNRRLTSLAAIQLKADRAERQEDWLLSRLLELREDRAKVNLG